MMPESRSPLSAESGAQAWFRIIQATGQRGLAVRDDHPVSDPVELIFRRRVGRALPGDRVRYAPPGVVEMIDERRSVFGRGDERGRFQPLAANIDTLWIVIAPEPAPSVDSLHRYVAAARIQGIEPVLIINKCDLAVPDQPPFDQIDELHIPVHRCAALHGQGLTPLVQRLHSGIHLLVGQSGVGKSSLANALLPDLELQTARLSRSTGKGRHTTTSTRLFHTPQGGWLADSPGVWEYGLWRMDTEMLQRGFPEFRTLPPCRFRDCRHTAEPGCAVREAADRGDLPPSRYQAWLRLLREQQRLAD